MSLRAASPAYAPMPHDKYYTPGEAVAPLIDYARLVGLFDASRELWECAAGAGHVAHALQQAGYRVFASDLHPAPEAEQLVPVVPGDFLKSGGLSAGGYSIVTNPPYGKQSSGILAFLAHAHDLLGRSPGALAMLLPFEFDARGARTPLVGAHPWWCAKVTVAKRIRWANLPQRLTNPMGHHAWFVWSSDPVVQRRARAFPQMVAA